MTEKNPPYVLQNRTDHPADSWRLMMAGMAGRHEGVFGPNDLSVTQDSGSNMNSRVSVGGAAMFGDESITQGLYAGYNDAAVNLTHTAAPGTPGQTRFDLVCARTRDAVYSGATNAWDLRINAGTASASPADPSLASNEIALARVSIAFGQTTVTNANITDLRPRFTANGGVTVGNSARRPGILYGPHSINALGGPAQVTAQEGMVHYDTDTDKLMVYNGSSWKEVATVQAATDTWTPSWTIGGAVTKSIFGARYQRNGNYVMGNTAMTYTSGATANAAWNVTLPVNHVVAANTAIGSWWASVPGDNNYAGTLYAVNAGPDAIAASIRDGVNQPFFVLGTPAASTIYTVMFCYPVA